MNILWAQLILAGSGDDGGNWMNMLVFIVLAVFWIIGGIMKATAKKPQDRQKQPPSARKSVRQARPPAPARGSLPSRPSQRTQARPQLRPRLATYIAEVEKALQAKTAQTTEKVESALPSIPAEPVSQFTAKPIIELEEMRRDAPHQISEAEDLPELVLDYSDPDELSKAILHYEILGPPISLRNPASRITDS